LKDTWNDGAAEECVHSCDPEPLQEYEDEDEDEDGTSVDRSRD
jgi:hypothetical protein